MSAIDKSGIYETNAKLPTTIFYATLFCIAHPTSPSILYAMLRCYCIPVFIIHNMYYYYIYLVFLHIVLPKYSARESNLVKKDNDNVVITFCDSVTFCDKICHICHTYVTSEQLKTWCFKKNCVKYQIDIIVYVLFIIFYVNYVYTRLFYYTFFFFLV